MIKVLGLSHKIEKQSDTRIYWFMFHKIYRMYSAIKNKEEINADMVLSSMSAHEESNKVNKELEYSCDNDENNQSFLQKWSFLLISIIPNQYPRRYGTAMKFGLIPTEVGKNSSVIISYFRVN